MKLWSSEVWRRARNPVSGTCAKPRDAHTTKRSKILVQAPATQHLTRCDVACSWKVRSIGQGFLELSSLCFPAVLAPQILQHLPCSLANRLVIRGRKRASRLPARPMLQRLNSWERRFRAAAGRWLGRCKASPVVGKMVPGQPNRSFATSSWGRAA